MTSPVVFTWKEFNAVNEDGEIGCVRAMVPHPRYGKVAERQFSNNESYSLVVLEERSQASHNYYFASIQEGFDSIPETMAARWPTTEHLRKWILIETGWFDEKDFECDSEANARSLGAFIRTEDTYARILIHGTKVIVRRAKSQSMKAMGKADFEASKKAVLDTLAAMIGVSSGDLGKNAGKSA